jgi:hypothetical protein
MLQFARTICKFIFNRTERVTSFVKLYPLEIPLLFCKISVRDRFSQLSLIFRDGFLLAHDGSANRILIFLHPRIASSSSQRSSVRQKIFEFSERSEASEEDEESPIKQKNRECKKVLKNESKNKSPRAQSASPSIRKPV